MNKKIFTTTLIALVTLLMSLGVTAAVPNNHSPYFEPISEANTTVMASENLSFYLEAYDPDPQDQLTFGADSLPTGATLSTSTGEFDWTPSSEQAGTWKITFSVSDGQSSGYMSVNFTVLPAQENQAPVFSPMDDQTIEADQNLSFQLRASDPDGDELEFGSDNLPSGSDLSTSTGYFTWTPTVDDLGTTSIDFFVTDGMATDTLAIMIRVVATTSQNHAPVISNIEDMQINENESLSFYVEASDRDGDQLFFELSPLPSGASFSTSSGLFEWTPDFEQSGSYFLELVVSDGNASSSENFTINVFDKNRPPILSLYHPVAITAGEVLTITASSTDPDGDNLDYMIDSNDFIEVSTGVFSWDTASTSVGDHIFTVTVSDQEATTTASAMVSIASSTPPNQAPSFDAPAEVELTVGTMYNTTISVNDPDGDPVTVTAENLPDGASFSSTTLEFSWQPSDDQIGEHYIQFLASDSIATSAFELHITVVAQDDDGDNGGGGTVEDRIRERQEMIEERLDEARDRVQDRRQMIQDRMR